MTLDLAGFAREALTSQADRLGVQPEGVVREALLYYVSGLGAKRPARRVPRFARRTCRPPLAGRLDISVQLDEHTWRSLEEEAERQRLPLERLLEHAVLYYLADLEAGRVAARIIERLEDGP